MHLLCIRFAHFRTKAALKLGRLKAGVIFKWKSEAEMEHINDPDYPEFPPGNEVFPSSPTRSINMPQLGEILIKDESVHKWSGTHKDRMAWEVVVSYKNIEKAITDGRLKNQKLPSFSLTSSGSAALAIGRMLAEHSLPKLKVLSDVSLEEDAELCNAITSTHCELYLTEMSRTEISVDQTLWLTNNQSGFDLTDFHNTTRAMYIYDWLCYEILNENPDYIFVPYGTGTLFREITNILRHEASIDTVRDRRLSKEVSASRLRGVHVLGATSNNPNTKADKLYAPYRPYHNRNMHEAYYYKSCGYVGEHTGVYTIQEHHLTTAFELAKSAGVECEHSGCAGLALLHQMRHEIESNARVLVVNTGKLRL